MRINQYTNVFESSINKRDRTTGAKNRKSLKRKLLQITFAITNLSRSLIVYIIDVIMTKKYISANLSVTFVIFF